jgi:glycosyltransferase involved in cell wall biosynthesis
MDGRLRWHAVPSRSSGTWFEQTTLARTVARLRPDVFFGAGYTAPLRLGCPSVVAIYDVSFFAHPEWFPRREGWRRRRMTRASARRAHAVVTISEFSASEITGWLGIPRTSIHLAPPGAPAPPACPPAPASDRERLILFAGSLFNRRNIPLLLEAFGRTAAEVPDARLVLAGDNRTSPRVDPMTLARALGLADHVEWRAYVDDAELADLYGRARVFAFLSEYEGFAMTPLEALAHGVPSVLLDTPIAREVYADGALLVTRDQAAVSRALALLLQDDAAHQRVVAAGRARMARFSWDESATRVRHALEHAARTGRPA